MKRLPSASELTRVFNCPPSMLMPAAYFSGPWAIHGRTVHRFLKMAAVFGRMVALEHIGKEDPAYRACEDVDLAYVPKGGGKEIAFAYNWRTWSARILGYDLERAYVESGLRPDEFPGSADDAGANEDVALVTDYKTGWYTMPAKDSWQLLLLGVAAADVYKKPAARVAHLCLPEGRRPRWDIVELDALALHRARGALASLAQNLVLLEQRYAAGAQLDVSMGDWCRFCPAFDRCPAQNQLAQQMLVGLDQLGAAVEVMTVDQLSVLLQKFERWEALKGRVMEHVDMRVRRGDVIPVPSRGYYADAPGRAADEITNHRQAVGIVRELCGEKYAAKAMTTTKGAIEEAVREYAVDHGRAIGVTQAWVLNEIRLAGAMEKTPGEVKPRYVKKLLGG